MRLWNNYSASQIGAMLNRTRNAIIGKVNRLVSSKQFERSNSHKIYLERRARMPRSSPPKPKLEVKIVEQPPPQQPIEVKPARPCTIYGLTSKRCHWPLGDTYEPAKWFCGEPALDGRPYCRHHCQIAYYGFHSPGQVTTGREARLGEGARSADS